LKLMADYPWMSAPHVARLLGAGRGLKHVVFGLGGRSLGRPAPRSRAWIETGWPYTIQPFAGSPGSSEPGVD